MPNSRFPFSVSPHIEIAPRRTHAGNRLRRMRIDNQWFE
jgi:hypothetical protein